MWERLLPEGFFSESSAIITVMGMSVLWFILFIRCQRGWKWSREPLCAFEHARGTQTCGIRSDRLPALWDESLPWHVCSSLNNLCYCFWDASKSPLVDVLLLSKRRPSSPSSLVENKPLDHSSVVVASQDGQVFIFTAAVFTYYIILPENLEAFYEFWLVRCGLVGRSNLS